MEAREKCFPSNILIAKPNTQEFMLSPGKPGSTKSDNHKAMKAVNEQRSRAA